MNWKVDLEKRTEKVELIIEVNFYKLHIDDSDSNGFSLAQYRRLHQETLDTKHDQLLLEEAIFSIDQEVSKDR